MPKTRVIFLFLLMLSMPPALGQISTGGCSGMIARPMPEPLSKSDLGLNVQRKLANSLHVEDQFNREGNRAIYQNLRHKLNGDKDFSCMMSIKLNPDGKVSGARILQSSGSKQVDSKAVDFVRSAAPFGRSAASQQLSYIIELPVLCVKLAGN